MRADVEVLFAVVHEFGSGPSLPLRNVRRLVAIEGEADIAWKSSAVWVWTRSGPLSVDLLSRKS